MTHTFKEISHIASHQDDDHGRSDSSSLKPFPLPTSTLIGLPALLEAFPALVWPWIDSLGFDQPLLTASDIRHPINTTRKRSGSRLLHRLEALSATATRSIRPVYPSGRHCPVVDHPLLGSFVAHHPRFQVIPHYQYKESPPPCPTGALLITWRHYKPLH